MTKNSWLVTKVEEIKLTINYFWRKKYLETFVCFALFGSLLLYLLFNARLNDLLVFNTLVVIIWYSRETMDLKRISNKQTERLRIEHKTNLRPYLRLQKKAGENKLQLVNEGKGVAVNLRSIYEKKNNKVKLPGITAMAAAPGSVTEGLTPLSLGIDFDSDEDSLVTILYNDIEGRNYRAVFRRNADYNDKFEIVEQRET